MIIEGATVSSDLNNITLRANDTERRKFSVIRIRIQAKRGNFRSQTWLPEGETGSISNLLAVLPGETLELRVKFEPEEFKTVLPQNFITWQVQGPLSPVSPNTIAHSFFWSTPQELARIGIGFPLLHYRRLVYVRVPDIGTLNEVQAAATIAAMPLGLIVLGLIRAYAATAESMTAPLYDPRRNALRHSSWMAQCASNVGVGAGIGLFFATAHEVSAQGYAFDTVIDLFNNQVGSTIFRTLEVLGVPTPLPDLDAIMVELSAKYAAGELRIWDHSQSAEESNGQVIKSNGERLYPGQEAMP